LKEKLIELLVCPECKNKLDGARDARAPNKKRKATSKLLKQKFAPKDFESKVIDHLLLLSL